MKIDFIGIGAQKSGTSWLYACLYEHPEVCAPIKEIHFFSRSRYEKGTAWYESHFTKCEGEKKRGEFSTSYLYSSEAPARIKEHYPDVKLIAILRNPVTRAYSQYRNAIKAGEIPHTMTFDTYREQEKSVIEQGKYTVQLKRYFAVFPHEQILVLIQEDIEKDRLAFIQRVYAYIGVDTTFVPTMLDTYINIARTPRIIFLERMMHHVAEALRKVGFDHIVWVIRKLGIPDIVRNVNTKNIPESPVYDHASLAHIFRDDARQLMQYIGRDMVKEWNLS